mgnify:CR=1 FL=1
MTSFYGEDELKELGFRSVGKNVYISRKASFYGLQNMIIGDYVRIDDFCILSGDIKIGNHIHIAAYSALYGGTHGIVLSDFVTLSSRNIIYAESDDYVGASLSNPLIGSKYRKISGQKVIFEKHVLVGTNCTILPGAYLAEGVSIAAMSLVKNKLEAWTVYAGIPVKKIKNRDMGILRLEQEYLMELEEENKDNNEQ